MSDGPPPPAPARSPSRDLVDGLDVVAVDDDRRQPVRRSPVRRRMLHRRHRADRRVLHVQVVLADEHDRRLPDDGHVQRLVERADVRGPVAEEADRDLLVPRYCADHAAPSAIGRWAPTIAYEPIMWWSTSVMCIEPPLPPISPVARPNSSA
jgi:hypothetical protein